MAGESTVILYLTQQNLRWVQSLLFPKELVWAAAGSKADYRREFLPCRNEGKGGFRAEIRRP